MKSRWYAAHAVYVFEVIDKKQQFFTVMENILLIRSRSPGAAQKAAFKIARKEDSGDTTLTVDNQPARQRFVGIRKVVACAADAFDESSEDGSVVSIQSGTEATYLTYRLESKRALTTWMNGSEIDVTFEE